MRDPETPGNGEGTRRGPTAREAWENAAAGDDIMEDDLTEERDVSPERREDVAETLKMDP